MNDWIEAKHDFHSWPTLRLENRRELLAIRRAIFTAMAKVGAPIAAGADAPSISTYLAS